MHVDRFEGLSQKALSVVYILCDTENPVKALMTHRKRLHAGKCT